MKRPTSKDTPKEWGEFSSDLFSIAVAERLRRDVGGKVADEAFVYLALDFDPFLKIPWPPEIEFEGFLGSCVH